jgi:endonuclease/exonuclease/phosphatase (EEP) superfamily protein YafD
MKTCFRRLVLFAAIAYPTMLLAVVLAFRFVGERWWFTGAALYLPRVGFAVPLPLVVIALVRYRMRLLLLAQLAAGGLVLFPLMGLVLPSARSPTGSGPTMRVLSLNANSGYSGIPALLEAVDHYSPDLVVMQEIAIGADDPLIRALQARYATVNATGQFVVASRFPLSSIQEPNRFLYGNQMHSPRYMRYVGETPVGRVAIYNIHPVSPRQGFYRIRGAGLRNEIASGRLFEGAAGPDVQANSGLRKGELDVVAKSTRAETLPVLIVGDTNLPGLSPLLAQFEDTYQDGFREVGWGFGYTFPSKLPWMRIDRMFANSALRFEHFEVGCAETSDHLCIVADVSARPSR